MSAETDVLTEETPSPEISDAAMRAAFDKALPQDAEIESDEPEADAQAAKPAPKKTTPPSKKPQADDEEDEPEEDDEAEAELETEDSDEESDDESDDDEDETGDGSSTAYETALRLLKLKHFTADDLKSLSKARVVEIAARIRKDEAILTQKLEAASAKKASDKAASRPDAEDRPPVASKGLRENATRLSKLFAEDETSAIIEPLEWAYGQAQEAMTAMQASIDTKLAEMQEAIEETNSRNSAVVRENLRLRLQRKFPDYAESLEDERASGRVFKKMAALNASGDYKDNLDGLASDALSLVFKEQGKKKQSLLAKTSGGHKVNGQRQSAEKPDTSMDSTMRAIFDVSTNSDLTPGQRKRRLNRLSE